MTKKNGSDTMDPIGLEPSLSVVYRWSMAYLDTCEQAIQEGGDLSWELDFTRFIINSGIPRIMLETPAATPVLKRLLPYDGQRLADRALRLMNDATHAIRDGKGSGLPASVLKRLEIKLDLIAGRLATGGAV